MKVDDDMKNTNFNVKNQIAVDAELASLSTTSMSGLLYGIVLSSAAAQNANPTMLRVSLACKTLPVDAGIAAACLLQPEVGDLVLLCKTQQLSDGAQDNKWWILSVLQRGQPAAPAMLSVPGADAVSLQAPQLSLCTERLHVRATTVHVVARQLTRLVNVFHAIGNTVTEQCRTKTLMVEEVNSTQSGTELRESKDVMMLKGSQLMLDAQQTVRIDGKHILMG